MPTFAVIGRGKFPTDMLRHDRAYPADTTSALDLLRTDQREIYLRVSNFRDVTPDRWSSFNWTVVTRPGVTSYDTDYVQWVNALSDTLDN